MKRKVPGSVPGVLPLIRHGNNVVVEHMEPFPVPNLFWPRSPGIYSVFLEPFINIVIVVLLRPQHAGQGLTHNFALLRRDGGGSQQIVEFVCFPLTGT